MQDDALTHLDSHLRRRLLQVAGAFFLPALTGLESALAAAPPTPTPLERATFAAFLDVLLPRDAYCASATALGVDAKLWTFAQLDSRFARLLGLGCHWLNLTGGPGFADLPDRQKIVLVQWMSASDWNQVPRRFYELVRQVAVEVYYSEPAAWAGLALQRPPQPLGYPPPWQ